MALLCSYFTAHSQSKAPIGFDIRGRDCAGGGGLCSVNKTSSPNNDIDIQKLNKNTFVLNILRASLTLDEEISVAGNYFSSFQAILPKIFIQDGDLQFNNDVLEVIGIDPKYNLLKTGNYPMQIKEDEVIITLTLTERSKK